MEKDQKENGQVVENYGRCFSFILITINFNILLLLFYQTTEYFRAEIVSIMVKEKWMEKNLLGSKILSKHVAGSVSGACN